MVGTTYESSFRTKHALPSGFLTERIALPWRLDLSAWTSYGARRDDPWDAITKDGIQSSFRGIRGGDEGYHDMVRCWTELGFVIKRVKNLSRTDAAHPELILVE